jgi:hypothetical protein
LRSSIIVGLSALIWASSVALAQEPSRSGAKLFIDQTAFDFGYIPSEATVSHVFQLYNHGTDSLKILNVKPG